MSGEGGTGRGAGRGLSMLNMLAAARTRSEQAAPPVGQQVPAPAQMDSVSAAPTPPLGRGAVMMQLARARSVGTAASAPPPQEPQVPVGVASGTSEPSEEAASAPTNPLGRGMMYRLMSLKLNPKASPSISPVSASVESSRPPSGFKQESSVPSPTLEYQEKPPVIKMGESGMKIPIIANYIRLKMDPDKGIFEYEVRFEPAVDSKDIRFKLLKQHQDKIGPAKTFDGVTLYLPFKFPDPITYLQSTHPATEESVMIKVILRQKRSPADSIHFYNVLIRRIARILNMVQMKRNYFNPHSPIFLPAEKLQLWPGLATAVNEYEDGLMLCCDVSFRVLRTTTVLDEFVEMSKKGGAFHQTAQDVLVGLSVLTRYNNKMYRIDEILFDMNPMSTFDYQGGQITYCDYYKKNYDIEIKDKGQPLLLNRAKKKVQGKEDETQLICLIPELCFLTGLDDRLRSSFSTMRALATHTRVPPMEREKALQSYIDSVKSNEKATQVLSEWGLTLDDSCLRMEGRVLDPEKIILSRSQFTTNPTCEWGKQLANDVLVPVKVNNWILVCTERDSTKTQEFSKCLLDLGGKMGIRIAPPKMVILQNDRTDTYISRIRAEINPSLELVCCVFPTARDDRYNSVKTLLCADYAVPSQMINAKTIMNANKLRSVVQKIALQINCKLGGEAWAVNIPTKTLMVCGVDVYHDPTRRGQSVVGFVASINPALTRWYSRAKYQLPGVELVSTLKLCLIESLKKYYEVNHDYPKQIVVYRDGVGDGQMQYVMDHEVPQMMSAFQAVVPPIDPKFTMVVVQKRINTRFFRATPSGPANPPPGTVVDHTVMRRNFWDFCLVSQHVTQGTVSPTHYIIVHDGGMKPDNLQKLTYKMTMMYWNWTGTVRVPASCQYAHKLAYLVGENIRKEVKEELCNRLYFL